MIELGEQINSRFNWFLLNGSKVCDVGSDHACLPVYLIQNNQITSAIAGSSRSYQRSKQFRVIEWETASAVRFGDGPPRG